MKNKYTILKAACYTGNITMSVTANLSPVLFLTFKSMYGISYSLLGLLVLINFVTQLGVDLIFSFFSHRFNIAKTVKLMPVIALTGFTVYALFPFIFPNHVYIGLVIGTFIFSASSGLAEVLLSPIIAAIPSEKPDKEMSKLHSSYAWGVVFAIAVSTLFLTVFGSENWQYLALGFTAIPFVSAILFSKSDIPEMETPQKISNTLHFLKNRGVWLCVFAIFLGGSAECSMAQWSSSYLEAALGMPKVVGDILGVAMFAVMLGLGRTLYTKYGKNIEKIIFYGAVGATLCYVVCAFTNYSATGLFVCAFTGFCTSMMWPGSLIISSKKYPQGNVMIYALMAAGGDFGASVGPQLIGIVTDIASQNNWFISFAQSAGKSPDVMGMKLGLLVGGLFPLVAIFVFCKFFKETKEKGSSV